MSSEKLTQTKNKIGRFPYNNINDVGGYPVYFLGGDVFEEIDEILGRSGIAIYFNEKNEEPISVYHFNKSTIKITINELTQETCLSIFGNAKETSKKLEEIFS